MAPRIGHIVPRRRIRLVATAFAVSTLAAMGAFAFMNTSSFGEDLRWRSVDKRFENRGVRNANKDIAIVSIDNNTDLAFNERYPYPRSFFAHTVDTLTKAGAKAIVLDVQFLEQTEPAEDRALVAAIAESGKVVLATAPEGASGVTEASASKQDDSETPMPFRSVKIEGVDDVVSAINAEVGNSQQAFSIDDVRRWVVPFNTSCVEDCDTDHATKRKFATLSVAGLAVAEGRSPLSYEDELPNRIAINYVGPSSSIAGAKSGFEYHNMSTLFPELFDKSKYNELGIDPELGWAKNKIVFVGATSAVLQDLHETPFTGKSESGERTRQMPGVEIHAQALNTILEREWLVDESDRSAALTASALVLIIWLLLTLTPMWSGIAMSAALCGGYLFYAQRVFETDNRVLLIVPVLAAAIAALGSCVVVLATSAIRERRHITGLFSRYVSPEVVRELVDVHEGIKLGGERREVSLLFSDIRGFTTMSEGLDPAELVAHLNEYFEEMVEAVELERGTLDKFIGDGLMAIFGAPLHQEDHADRACAAALDMVERLRRFNDRRKEQGLSQLEIGIGIHTGEAIIGNIGSPSRRVDYTAIGDTVNLASRMESSTKDLGCQILVSKETASAASEHMFKSHGEITVKGRTAATKVFELTGGGNAANGTTSGSSFDVGGKSSSSNVDAA